MLHHGLIVAQVIYAYKFIKTLWHLLDRLDTMGESMVTPAVLNLIGVVMSANLLLTVIVGGYETFVSKLNTDDRPNRPERLDHVNASALAMAFTGKIMYGTSRKVH